MPKIKKLSGDQFRSDDKSLRLAAFKTWEHHINEYYDVPPLKGFAEKHKLSYNTVMACRSNRFSEIPRYKNIFFKIVKAINLDRKQMGLGEANVLV